MAAHSMYFWLMLAAAGSVTAEETTTGGTGINGAPKASLSASRGRHGDQDGPTTADMENLKFYTYLFVVMASIVGALLVYRIVMSAVRHVRTITCLNNKTQRYFAIPDEKLALAKEHLLYAPLFKNHHTSESTWYAKFGVLPTRLQTVLLVAYFGTNVAFCVLSIHWSASRTVVLAEFRNRTGILAVVNLIPLFIMSSRNNLLIAMLNIPYDTFNLMHRWIGRLVVLESVAHTLAYLIATVPRSGWPAVGKSIANSKFVLGGFLTMFALLFIILHSPSAIRHAFYETFLHIHIALAVASIVGLWLHLRELPQLRVLQGVIGLWLLERLVRLMSLIYRNLGKRSMSKALVETLPGDAMRVTLDLARPWTFKPGQHIFLYIPSVGLWTSHPFTVAWSEEAAPMNNPSTDEKVSGLPLTRQDVLAQKKTRMSLVVRRRTGFTDDLFKKAERHGLPIEKDGQVGSQLSIRAFIEGPYGPTRSLDSYGTVMLIAGGIGITHQLPYVRHLVSCAASPKSSTVATRRIILIWILQSPEHLEWIRDWMTAILAIPGRRDYLRVKLFVTRPRNTREIVSPSATVQMFPGRPDVETLISQEAADEQVGAMAVSVCGPGSLCDSVRSSVRRRVGITEIDFVEEAFSW